ncbi:hypothetical protein FJY68_01090 [candidate division WOR-3 bacterium]|uniref:Guanylate cyclase domain-containing protein n=1 Tax=candidate division WOR-3 bacterium TaxID=2052148 RepID=A0A937XCE6_UNCW3|nr:hypothetical protein [candidate division WOR-3 bacterium]
METREAATDLWRENDYTMAAVAYFDMFGFSVYLRRSDTKIRDVLTWLDELDRETDEGLKRRHCASQLKSAVFSDCMVRALPVGISAATSVETLLLDAIRVQRRLTATVWTRKDQEFHRPELPVRGGINVGQLYWGGRHVFGEALVEAVDLEKKMAVWPRVVVDLDVELDQVDEWRYPPGFTDFFACGIDGFPLLLEDNGVRYLNYLAPIQTEFGEWSDMQFYNKYLRDHKSLILKFRESVQRSSQMMCIEGWAEYHNSVVRHLKEDRHASSYLSKKELLVDL